jgi:hypothetical protein
MPAELLNPIMRFSLSIGTIYVDLAVDSSHKFLYVAADNKAHPLSHLLAMTRVCRRIHTNYRLWPYTINTFELYSSEIVEFINLLPMEYLDLITKIKVERHLGLCTDFWEAAFVGLGMLDNLRKVTLIQVEGEDFSAVPETIKRDLEQFACTRVDVDLETVYPSDVADVAVGRCRLFHPRLLA